MEFHNTLLIAASRSKDGFVCLHPSVCLFVHLLQLFFLTMFLSSDLHETYTRHSSYGILTSSTFFSHLLLPAYLMDSLDIWHKYHPWGEDVLHTISRVKGQGHTGFMKFCCICFYRVHSIALCLFVRFSSYVAEILPLRGRCAACHIQVRRLYLKYWPLTAKECRRWLRGRQVLDP